MDKDIIIDYEELFKDDENNKRDLKLPDQTNNSVLTVVLYVLLFLVGFAQLLILPFFSQKDSGYLVLEKASLINHTNYLYVLNESDLIAYNDEFNINENYIYVKDGIAYITYYEEIVNDRDNFILKIDDIISGERIYFYDEIIPEGENLLVYINYASDLPIEISNTNKDVIENTLAVTQQSILLLCNYIIVTIALIIPNFNKIKYDFSLIKSDTQEKPFLTNLVSSTLLMVAVALGLGLITQIIASIFNFSTVSANQDSINMLLNSKYAFLTIITITIFGPLVEELVFRGAIFNLIKSPKAALITSSVTFGLIHITTELLNLSSGFQFLDVIQIIVFSLQYIGMGVFLGYLYEKNNRNIIFIYGVHALYNLLVSLL